MKPYFTPLSVVLAVQFQALECRVPVQMSLNTLIECMRSLGYGSIHGLVVVQGKVYDSGSWEQNRHADSVPQTRTYSLYKPTPAVSDFLVCARRGPITYFTEIKIDKGEPKSWRIIYDSKSLLTYLTALDRRSL